MVVSQTLQRRYRETHGIEAFYVPNGGVLRERNEPREDPGVGARSGQVRTVSGEIFAGERLPFAGRGV